MTLLQKGLSLIRILLQSLLRQGPFIINKEQIDLRLAFLNLAYLQISLVPSLAFSSLLTPKTRKRDKKERKNTWRRLNIMRRLIQLRHRLRILWISQIQKWRGMLSPQTNTLPKIVFHARHLVFQKERLGPERLVLRVRDGGRVGQKEEGGNSEEGFQETHYCDFGGWE